VEGKSWKSRARSTVSSRVIAGTVAIASVWLPITAFAQTSHEQPSVESALETTPVAIAGRVFQLEFALSPLAQRRGLGGRSHIGAYGGMLFVWESARPRAMVMRECRIPIDVAFLDGWGRVVALHAMKPELPRGESETNRDYESRLPSYRSGKPSHFAVELAGGRLAQLGIQVGDPFVADWPALVSRRAEINESET